jgi:hypothetical protein
MRKTWPTYSDKVPNNQMHRIINPLGRLACRCLVTFCQEGMKMNQKAKQWYYLSEVQLLRLVGHGTYSEAPEALGQVQKIKDAGHSLAIYYSEFNGFRVIDEDDPEQLRIGLSIQSRAKPFYVNPK